jgi:hypothetical protein
MATMKEGEAPSIINVSACRTPMEMIGNADKRVDVMEGFDDILSVSIRDGSRGFTLAAVVAVSTCMASISVLLILQYVPPEATLHQQQSAAVEPDQCSVDPNLPLWADLMDKQIQIIQNLVHASLLGGSGFVAAYRGDPVWLYFARNCCFYFGLAAISYFALDLSRARFFGTSFIMSGLLGFFCIAAFVRLEVVRHEVNRLVAQYARGEHEHHEVNLYLKSLPSTRSQLVKTTLIARLADCLQIVSVVYMVVTTMAASRDEDCDSITKVGLLEASYREGAHQAFLLSMLFLVTTYPGDPACIGGAIFCSGWRSLLAMTYLVPLLTVDVFSSRDVLSLVATIVELTLTFPIFVAALLLLHEKLSSTLSVRTGAKSSTNVKYSRLDEEDGDEADAEPAQEDEYGICRIQSLSMFQISKSSNFSSQQRCGAFAMWMSSACLLVGMTVECMLLNTTYNSHEVYQWGMHVCAMYLFCTHMSVGSIDVYSRARWLLAIACPAGSVVAAWQLWILFGTGGGPHDIWSFAASIMFAWRALCGIGQSIGLMLLRTTKAETEVVPDMVAVPVLSTRLSTASFVLFKVYIPIIFLNIVWEAYSYSCSEPLISPTTPECVQKFFLLAKSWPALGTFFHFGGLLIIFSSDAISVAGTYPPSLIIATFFALHVATLLVADLTWTFFVRGDGEDSPPVQELLLQLVWAMAVGWLGISLNRIWKWRIAEG